ncbi:MAG: endonuclease [Subdoligranulum variabile]|nr:MAG: endonuclease [Subdoligranulum variabile]
MDKQEMLARARELRRGMTPQERHLWYDYLRDCPWKFTRQKIAGAYILDFYCHAARLAVEVDGSQHYEAAGQQADARRTAALQAQGIAVLRVSNADVNVRFAAVCEGIANAVQQRIAEREKEK